MVSLSSKLTQVDNFVQPDVDKDTTSIQTCLILMKVEYDNQKAMHIKQKEAYDYLKTNKTTLTATERKGVQADINELKKKRQKYQDDWLVLYEKLKLLAANTEHKIEHQEVLEKIKNDFQNPTWRV